MPEELKPGEFNTTEVYSENVDPNAVYVGDDHELHNHDVRRVISTEPGDEANGEPPIRSFVEEVTPNVYHVAIRPEDWKLDGSLPKCEFEVIGMHENGLCYIYPNDGLIMQQAEDKEAAAKLLEDVYGGDFEGKTEMHRLKCQFNGPTPTVTLFLDIEELPFFDVPGSRFGIE